MKFYKISEEQFNKDFDKMTKPEYSKIKLPKRATKNSAGYDFYSPFKFILKPGASIKIPTAIKIELDDDKFLMIVPRSSLGFKYRLQLDNTAGVIDADYINSDNEGHIWIKLTNDTKDNKVLIIEEGDAIAQGIIIKYHTVDDDDSDGIRNGGFGSTNK